MRRPCTVPLDQVIGEDLDLMKVDSGVKEEGGEHAEVGYKIMPP
jgi:hypothetical protein